MEHLPVYQLIVEAADRWPDRPCVYDEYGSLNFREVYEQAEGMRQELLGLGIGPGMGVGLKARNGRNFIVGLLAVVGTGAAVMPVYHQLKRNEIETLLEEAKLHVLLDDKSSTPYFDRADLEIFLDRESYLVNFIEAYKEFPFAPHVKNPAFVRFTSGTTGKSKGVIVSHQSVIERIDAANKGLQLGPDDTVIWVLPMAYHFIVSVVLYIKFGAAIAIVKDFMAKNIIEATNRYHGSLLYASPLQIRLLAHDGGQERMDSLQRVISTSSGISADICEAFKNRFQKEVSQAYGIIEIGLPILNYKKSEEQPAAVGYPQPGYTVQILGDDHKPLPFGRAGHLGIKGPGMFDAYLSPPVLRESVLVNGYFLTADYASQEPDGLIKIEGRSRSVINISGIKIFPEEIESVLEMIPGIRQAKISSSPHALLGQIIEGEIVVDPGASIDISEVLIFCRKRLSNFKAPQRIRIVDELSMTNTGKLKRD